ncbi:glycine--tRNA ligase [Candidatus Daviesbacteria bacterium RIFCSPHIGHO2_01_FULL_44_29]|uniref:Glycine--tRNA ligase n=1 Tax=Candidatus Daviesbacteria bacterium RIFCSPHIGHO2_02_FULL_43_12 TaxID=1797776 RepID=A0A1F5KK80_9BACT|nr:MAG: glycine--tRNA ligase [Candidatus Daviesbacteria bacterium RIFCSPHIGHO2_01_FULL_44_29]OGE40860.1 MAG: glycine--tRNA ligase [Candidatus Daviesbacteria bacterium RIFCSPHIGHO2_12_FULL_47_45]OGE41284.1 MAG: glycine--tRNA ligase [Candidatus Daviesbacteria bacterium RIFCSPHIGHO2_02_FULL_43_12]OGE69485.1 MAG: glycine--tRNA ligase [Candidatus Daviesbacteria bacterium RIFCSPLOWO2_01_FULL_43_15]
MNTNTQQNLMEKIVALCKRRGFIFPGSEIYGGLGGTWDYGPLGVLLKKNLKDIWWKEMVQLRSDIVGVDAAIMMNPKAWEASGHVEAFTDPLVECKICHSRLRADKQDEIKDHELSHNGKKVEWTEPQQFNLLVKAYLGVIEGKQSEIFLRGEITNGVHVNFRNVIDSTRVRIPFGIAQVGKAFRNEITPGNFTFRSREFEQMEVQFYIKPEEKEGEKWFEYWKQNRMDFYLSLGINKDNLRFRDHAPDERAHYAKAATDIEYNAPFGWSEFMGIHHRGDWDLSRHQKYSGQDMSFRDPFTSESYIPWDIETSAGVDRSVLFLLIDAYFETEDGRVVMKLSPKIAPFKAAVFPLLANKPELVEKARGIYESLKVKMMVAWDDRGNIGKRYASQDEAGTPFCITVDFDTLKDESVTVRDRDSATQERIKISDLDNYLLTKIF